MLVLIGPSASGKTEIANILIERYNMKRMITYTTRPKRLGEVDGVSYNFVSVIKFLRMEENGEFVETVKYNNNYYGTLKKDVTDDKIVILEPSGLNEFNKKMKDKILSFYLETDEDTRIDRMIFRKDSQIDIEKRITNDRLIFEKSKVKVDYIIKNKDANLVELTDKIYKLYKSKIK